MKAFKQGFISKCAELGVNPAQLVNAAHIPAFRGTYAGTLLGGAAGAVGGAAAGGALGFSADIVRALISILRKLPKKVHGIPPKH